MKTFIRTNFSDFAIFQPQKVWAWKSWSLAEKMQFINTTKCMSNFSSIVPQIIIRFFTILRNSSSYKHFGERTNFIRLSNFKKWFVLEIQIFWQKNEHYTTFRCFIGIGIQIDEHKYILENVFKNSMPKFL